MQASTYILTRRGWEAFTTNAVAERAGVNIASLYQYFPNKESIVAELQRRHVARARAVTLAPSPEQPLRAYLRTLVESGVREHRVDPALHKVFSEQIPRSARALMPVDEPDPAALLPAQTGSKWRVPDVELATFIATTAARAVVHEAAIERPQMLEHPLFVDELVELLMRYLRRPSAARRRRRRAQSKP